MVIRASVARNVRSCHLLHFDPPRVPRESGVCRQLVCRACIEPRISASTGDVDHACRTQRSTRYEPRRCPTESSTLRAATMPSDPGANRDTETLESRPRSLTWAQQTRVIARRRIRIGRITPRALGDAPMSAAPHGSDSRRALILACPLSARRRRGWWQSHRPKDRRAHRAGRVAASRRPLTIGEKRSWWNGVDAAARTGKIATRWGGPGPSVERRSPRPRLGGARGAGGPRRGRSTPADRSGGCFATGRSERHQNVFQRET